MTDHPGAAGVVDAAAPGERTEERATRPAGPTGPTGPTARVRPGGSPPRRRALLAEILTGLFLGLWALYQNLWHLGSANWMSDEPIYAVAGWRYVHGSVDYNLEHPLTAKYLIGLSQVLFGQHAAAIRLPAVAASLATGALLWWWARQEAGPAAGLLCGAMWTLLPRVIDREWGPRLDRYAMLEPFLALFAAAALYAGWRWGRTGRWRWAVLAGAALALAATSKESGVIVAPVVAVGGPLLLRARAAWRTALQLGLGAAVAAVVGVLTYAGAGTLAPIAYMLRFQSEHNSTGHPVAIRGHVTATPPWWANLWYNEQAYGVTLSVVLAAAVVAVIVLRRDALTVWVTAAVGVFLGFHCLVSRVALSFYFHAWQPEVTLLAALGIAELARRAVRGGPPVVPRIAAAVAAAVAVGCVLAASVATSVDTARLRPRGVARISQVLDDTHADPHGVVVITGFYVWEPRPYLVGRNVATGVPRQLGAVSAIAIHERRPRDPQDPGVLALVAANRGRLRHIRLDEVDLYLPTATLRPAP